MGKALVTLGGIQFCDNSGDPLNGGKVYAYQTGTSTPSTTYQDAALTTPHANPIVLDAYGRPPSNAIWVNEEVDLEVQTSAGVSLYTVDNFNPEASGFGGMATKNSNVLVKTTTYAVVAGDDGKFIVASGSISWTLSLLAAATAGDGFWFSFVNSGTGIITMNANSTETINGRTTLTFGPGEGGEFRCDGSNWRAVINGAVQKIAGASGYSGATLPLTNLVSAFRKYTLVFDSLRPATNNVTFYCRVSEDNDVTPKSGASDYAWSQLAADGTVGATAQAVGDDADSEIEIAQSCGNLAAENIAGEIEIFHAPGARPQILYRWTRQSQAPTYFMGVGGGQYKAGAITMNAIRFLFASGNIANMNYTLYGHRA